MAFIEGLLLGLGMIIFLGPVFFQLLQGSLEHGARVGFAIALGIFTSDLLVILLCNFGLKEFFSSDQNQYAMAVVGCAILMVLGITYLVKKVREKDQVKELSAANLSGFFAKGFLVNFVNPFVFIIWISTIAYVESAYSVGSHKIAFFGGALFGILLTDSLKVVLADKLQAWVNPSLLNKIYKIIGIVLICFGLRLMFFVLK